MMQEMNLIYRTRTKMIINIDGREYIFYRTPLGIDIENDNKESLKVEWLL
jgi:hypothetical protein